MSTHVRSSIYFIYLKAQTSYDKRTVIENNNGTNVTMEEYIRVIGTSSGTNVLGKSEHAQINREY